MHGNGEVNHVGGTAKSGVLHRNCGWNDYSGFCRQCGNSFVKSLKSVVPHMVSEK